MAFCHRFTYCLIGLAVACILVGSARAQDAPTDTTAADTSAYGTPVTLPVLGVEAARAAGALAAPQRVTRIGRAAIEATGAADAAGLLSKRSGLFVQQVGMGGAATASARGAGSKQTLVLVDGQRVADPQSGQVDLSLLPTALLASATVQPGAGARYGSGTLGGVVRLRTLAPTDDFQTKATAEAGSFGARRGGGVVSGGAGPVRLLAAAEVSRVEGDFAYENDALFPTRTVRRTGADRSLMTLFGTAEAEAGPHTLRLTGWLNEVERGLPGTSNAQLSEYEQATARQQEAHRRLWARSTTRLGSGTFALGLRAQRTATRYHNPASQQRDTAQTTTLAADAQVDVVASDRWLVTGGAEGVLDRSRLRGGVRRTHGAAFAEAEGALGRWLVRPALRVDGYAAEGQRLAALSPALGVRVQPLAWTGLHLKARAARTFRAPTFGERFYEPGGNPGLTAERGWSAEVGAAAAWGSAQRRLTVEVTAFASRLCDQIVWYPSYVGPGLQVWTPRNVGRVRTRGLEASLDGRVRLADGWQIDGGLFFTHTAAENRANPDAAAFGRQLRYTPRQQFKAHLGAAWRGLRLDLAARAVGPRFTASDESQALGSYHVVDAQLRYVRSVGGARLTLGLGVDNLTGRRYQIIQFYPMPPRHARLRLTLRTGT